MTLGRLRLGTWLAALLPALGLAALVVKAEVAVHTGPSFRIPIRGYDPRDLLEGQYLRFQFDFDWQGSDSCHSALLVPVPLDAAGFAPRQPPPQAGCCLCLFRTRADGFNPKVRQVDCEEPRTNCDGWIRARDVVPPLRYFVPENRAKDLERALASGNASIEVGLPPSGTPAVKQLYLGDKPWREALPQKRE